MGIHMVNEEKLRIMVNLARYEQEPLHTELKEAGYYRIDYIRSHLLVTLWSYSVAYVLVLLLVALILAVLRLERLRSIYLFCWDVLFLRYLFLRQSITGSRASAELI